MQTIHHLLLTILVLFAASLHSQESYLPILEDGKAYLQLTIVCDASGGVFLKMEGDTAINNVDYTKVFSIVCDEEEPELVGFLRSNDTNSRLWYTDGEGEDKLLVDMDLEVGDIFTFPYFLSFGGSEEIQVVDIVEVNGRKEIIFDTPGGGCLIGPSEGPIRFIEGIGPTYDIVPTIQDLHAMLLHCVKMGDSIVYDNMDTEIIPYFDCMDTDCMPGSIIGSSSSVQVTPLFELPINPSQERLLVNSFVPKATFRITALSGEQLMTGSLNQGQNSIGISELSQGVYLITCYTEEGMQSLKFVRIR